MLEEKKPRKSRKLLWIILGIVAGIILIIVGAILISYFLDQSKSYSYLDDYSESYGSSESKSYAPMDLEEESSLSKSKEIPSTAAGSSSNDEGELTEQKVIKTGTITLQVEKADSSVTGLTNLAKSRGGFVLSSSLYTSSDETQSGTIILKVPVSKYEETMNEIKKFGDVQSESSTGQDVTEKYSDLQAQLKNYKAEEEQYLKILERADTVEDILKVTQKLSQVRGNIETTQGRIKYLEGQTDMSTITVSISEETRIDIPTKEWKPAETLKKAFRAWIQFLQGLVNITIWFVIFLGPVIVIIWIIVKLIMRKIRKNKSK